MTCPSNCQLKNTSVKQNGVSLIIVMIVLTVVSLLGIAGIQISSLGEKSARNDRDSQIAWQAAEAALLDAEFDIRASFSTRSALFAAEEIDTSAFEEGCGSSGNNLGLCAAREVGQPAWLTVDFTQAGAQSRTVPYGQFTNRAFSAGAVGAQPSRVPRYVVELVEDPGAGGNCANSSKKCFAYRVTAMGFGLRPEIQAVVQGLIRR
jgi:type IV pilus assembly protein PilX